MIDTMIREPAPEELERVLYLFSHARVPRESRLLAAVRSRPVERFVAAAAWWRETNVGRFQFACQPGVDRVAVLAPLIDRLAESARLAGMESIQYANALTDDNDWFEILQTLGFSCVRSERSFQIAYEDVWKRAMQLFERHRSRIPSSWRTKPIRDVPPEIALAVIESHRLLPPDDVRHFWREKTPGGFTLDLSCVLFEGERPFGAFLARRTGDVYYVDVQVVEEKNPVLRSLGDLYMMCQMLMLHEEAKRAGTDIPIRLVKFRSGEAEHRQTANVARRMGGTELPPQRVMGRRV